MHRADMNQKEIVDGLRELNISVLVLSQVGHGCPDLLVGLADGRNVLVEIKTDTGKLSETQVGWIIRWRGKVVIARSIEDVLSQLGYV